MLKQLRVTKEKVKIVKTKLKCSSVAKLSLQDLLVYLSYRLSELISGESVIDYNEIFYRLCEVGPANLRFDPLTVEIFLESEMSRDLFKANSIETENGWFYLKKDYKKEVVSNVKHRIFKEILENISSVSCLKLLKKNVLKIIVDSGYNIESSLIDEKKRFVECILTNKKFKGRILLRFYNDNEWIFPFSWQIWEVFRDAGKLRCVPILVASRIHGSCFPLFKAIGILARSTYGIFSEKNVKKIIDRTLSNMEKVEFVYPKIGPGRFYCLFNQSIDGLEGVEQLFSRIVPTYFNSSKKRIDHTTKKIIRILNTPLQHLLDQQSSKLKGQEKIARINEILTLKLGHLNTLQDVVRRHEALIKELGLESI